MSIVLAVVIGFLFASGLFLMLRRTLAHIIIGVGILTNAANLLIFTSAGLVRGKPPLIPAGATVPPDVTADPLPQALVLTAIVIGFGILAFTLVLAYRTFRAVGTDDVDVMRTTDI